MSRIGQSIVSLVAGLFLTALALPAWADDPPTTTQSTSAQSAPAQTASEQGAHRRPHAKKKVPPPLVLPPLPVGPLPQVPLPQIPASAPTVTYEKGLLTILAQNATLGEILKQVKKLTGASIEIPANGAPERVVTEIGPGAPRDVLAALLNGSQFNYVMLGSSSDPAAVLSVLLTPKPGSSGEGQPTNGVQQNAQAIPTGASPVQPFRQQVIAASQATPQAAAEDDNTGDETDDQDADQAGQTAQPENNQEQQQPNPNQPNAGPRTPEQLLQMMRQGQQPPFGQQPGQPPPMQPPPPQQ